MEATSSSKYWSFATPDNPEEIILGAYIKVSDVGLYGISATGNGSLLMTIHHDNSNVLISLGLVGRGLRIRTQVGLTATVGNVLTNGWNLLELKCKVHDTTGYIYAYVNGLEVYSITGIDTRSSSRVINYVRVYHYLTYQGVGDIYVCDTSGATNNDVLGSFHVQGLLPDANGDNSDWTPSAAADNYTMVNEHAPSEAEYVESGTSTDQDLYNYESLTGTWDTIFGLQMNSRLALDAAGSETVAVSCLSNVTQSDANFTVDETVISTGDEGKYQRILETDPDTAAAWTTSGVNAVQGGAKFI
jgi:hypothetical protein